MAVGTGDFSRAIDGLRLRVSNDSQDATSRIELARLLYQETKDAAQAMRYLDEAVAIAPDSQTLTAVRASILRAEGREAEARQILSDYVADYDSFEAYWMRAVYYAEGGELERAEQDYRRLTTFSDRATAGYDLLSGFYAATGRLAESIATIEEGLRGYPEDLRLKQRLMRLLFARGREQDRERAFLLLAELEVEQPEDPELLTTRAIQTLRDSAVTPQLVEEARVKLEDVVEREPTMIDAHLALIGIAMQRGQYQTASELAARALRSNANAPALLLARARAELALAYYPMAAKLAQQALDEDPNNPEAVEVLAQAALSSGNPSLQEQTRTLIESALRRGSTDGRIVLSKVPILVALNSAAEAIPGMEAYCQTAEGSRSVRAIITLADLYRMVGDTDKAEEAIEKAAVLEPSSQAVMHARLLLLVSMKRYDELTPGCLVAHLGRRTELRDRWKCGGHTPVRGVARGQEGGGKAISACCHTMAKLGASTSGIGLEFLPDRRL